jgi:5'-deoxynucleotidase YfbR-like HD superfamily hydrolase
MSDIKNLWFCTFTGKKFHPFNPKPEQICLTDIAHHLSLQCRYNGACRTFYSVAQHSILVAQLTSWPNRQWALLHDAAEAYLGDMVRPLKVGMTQYKEVEAVVEKVIAKKFGLPKKPDEVSNADLLALYAERRDLMDSTHKWSRQDELEPLLKTIPRIIPWPPETAQEKFLDAVDEYGICTVEDQL